MHKKVISILATLFGGGIECERFPPRFGCAELESRIKWYDPDSNIEVIEKEYQSALLIVSSKRFSI